MSSLFLTIKNFTSFPIEILRYEIGRQEDPQKRSSSWWSTHLNGSITPSWKSHLSQDVNTSISVLESAKVQLQKSSHQHETTRIFVKIGDEVCSTNMSFVSMQSKYLTRSKDNPDPHSQHFCIYHPNGHYLVITYDHGYHSWMSRVRDDVLLSALSIPGTHNSPACHRALPSVRCQVVSVRNQLRHGVRFLDIRVQLKHPSDPTNSDMVLVHGAFSVSLSSSAQYFAPLVKEVQKFLVQNPSETVIMSVKREGTGSGTDAHLSRTLRKHYANDHRYWYTAPRVPFLAEARGKIVLVRRFDLDEESNQEWGGAGWGIDAADWADNSPHSLCSGGHVCIQDFYQVLETKAIEKKIQYSVEHLQRAATRVYNAMTPLPVSQLPEQPREMPLFINFLTASNLWKTGCWPEKIAARLNPAILQYLCLKHNEGEDGFTKGDGSTGIVVCDWVGDEGNWDIVRCIIGLNARYERSSENPPASVIQGT